MKLENRERVDGTEITIGRRIYRSNGKKILSRKYHAEYRDANGIQQCRSMSATSVMQARRQALEIQQQLEKGVEEVKPSNITVEELTAKYLEIVEAKGAAPKTVWKYCVDIEKLQKFCKKKKIHIARQFTENDLYLYRQYLVKKDYSPKTVQGAIVLAKQVFKWAWRQKLLANYYLEAASFPKAKAKPQPCFTSEQVDMIIAKAVGQEKCAFALMGYAGLRIGEVEQLCWDDIKLKDGKFAMIHIRRGGSNGMTKDRDERFVPIHPKVAEHLEKLKQAKGLLLPEINERKLLGRIKQLCRECEFENPKQYKLHTFRHHFASICANHGVAHRKALAWLGHSNSEMLDLYYHLHDDDSLQTMAELAGTVKTSKVK